MIGIVVVAHGGLAPELVAAVEHVVGPLQQVRAVSTAPADDLRAKQAEINEAVASVDGGDGVVLVTDMFGGTPCNLAIGAMLVKLAKMRERPLHEAIDAAIDAGRKYIDGARRMLTSSQK